MRYAFRGDRFSRPDLRGHLCVPVLCHGSPVVGSNGNRLVEWGDGTRDVVPGRAVRPTRAPSVSREPLAGERSGRDVGEGAAA